MSSKNKDTRKFFRAIISRNHNAMEMLAPNYNPDFGVRVGSAEEFLEEMRQHGYLLVTVPAYLMWGNGILKAKKKS